MYGTVFTLTCYQKVRKPYHTKEGLNKLVSKDSHFSLEGYLEDTFLCYCVLPFSKHFFIEDVSSVKTNNDLLLIPHTVLS